MSTHPESIDAELVRDLMTRHRVVVLDARPHDDYLAARHQLVGAIRIVPGSGSQIDEVLRSIPNEKVVVAYCDEPHHAASAQIARRARELGLGDAVFLAGGFEGWKRRGYPVEKTPHADLPRESRPSL